MESESEIWRGNYLIQMCWSFAIRVLKLSYTLWYGTCPSLADKEKKIKNIPFDTYTCGPFDLSPTKALVCPHGGCIVLECAPAKDGADVLFVRSVEIGWMIIRF